jgi:hypothetical protein
MKGVGRDEMIETIFQFLVAIVGFILGTLELTVVVEHLFLNDS